MDEKLLRETLEDCREYLAGDAAGAEHADPVAMMRKITASLSAPLAGEPVEWRDPKTNERFTPEQAARYGTEGLTPLYAAPPTIAGADRDALARVIAECVSKHGDDSAEDWLWEGRAAADAILTLWSPPSDEAAVERALKAGCFATCNDYRERCASPEECKINYDESDFKEMRAALRAAQGGTPEEPSEAAVRHLINLVQNEVVPVLEQVCVNVCLTRDVRIALRAAGAKP